MENQQTQQPGLLSAVIKKVIEIGEAYENLGLGQFDNKVYQEIVSKGIGSIEQRFKNTYAEQIAAGQVHPLHAGAILYEKNIAFDALASAMPGLREFINELVPVGLITIVDSLPVLSKEDREILLSKNID